MRQQSVRKDKNNYIFPAHNLLARIAADVSHGMFACCHQTIFLWPERDIHPVIQGPPPGFKNSV